MEIKYVDVGIANNFGTHIELNEGLKAYPKLHDSILKHEMSHTNEAGFTREDFLLDIEQAEYSYKDMFWFMVHNPKSLFQFLPIYKKGQNIVYDLNMLIFYGLVLGVIGIAIFLAFYV